MSIWLIYSFILHVHSFHVCLTQLWKQGLSVSSTMLDTEKFLFAFGGYNGKYNNEVPSIYVCSCYSFWYNLRAWRKLADIDRATHSSETWMSCYNLDVILSCGTLGRPKYKLEKEKLVNGAAVILWSSEHLLFWCTWSFTLTLELCFFFMGVEVDQHISTSGTPALWVQKNVTSIILFSW